MYCHGLCGWWGPGKTYFESARSLLPRIPDNGLVHLNLPWYEACSRSQNPSQRHQIVECLCDKAEYYKVRRFWYSESSSPHRWSNSLHGWYTILPLTRDHWRSTLLLQEWYLVSRRLTLWALRTSSSLRGLKHAFPFSSNCPRTLPSPTCTFLKRIKNTCFLTSVSWCAQKTHHNINIETAYCCTSHQTILEWRCLQKWILSYDSSQSKCHAATQYIKSCLPVIDAGTGKITRQEGCISKAKSCSFAKNPITIELGTCDSIEQDCSWSETIK